MPLIDRDAEHLRLLSIFHYVYGAMTAALACFGLFYIAMGIFAAKAIAKMPNPQEPPPAFLGYIFVAMGAAFLLVGWTDAILVFLSGRFLARHTHPIFCMVVAAINCFWVPIGTALGVCTIIVLSRPSARALFQATPDASVAPSQV